MNKAAAMNNEALLEFSSQFIVDFLYALFSAGIEIIIWVGF